MKGTEKQIVWAEDIKATVIKTIETMLAMTENDPRANTDAAKAARAKFVRALDAVKACDNAHDLIEVYQGVSSVKTERENLSIVVARINNKIHVEYEKGQTALIGE